MKKVVVISLGGSLIIPNKIDTKLLKEFKRVLLKNTRTYKFVVVCGGGSTARIYIKALEENIHLSLKQLRYLQGNLGIASTRLNARFMTYFFGKDAYEGIPHDMKQIKGLLKQHDIVFCGALRYAKDETSDGTTAKIAHYFHSPFVNLTDVSGLHDKNPKKFKNAKFIPEISHKDFLKMANKIKFMPGQHFILDQNAAKIIKKYNIPTYLLGKDMKQFHNMLNHKGYIGTIICGD